MRNRLGFYNSIGMTARYELGGRFCKDIDNVVFGALGQLISQHPALGITLSGETSKNPLWVRLKQIDLKKIVRFVNEKKAGEITPIIESAHQEGFGSLGELPLWRVVVVCSNSEDLLHHFDVGFFFHHGLFDGGSGVAFHMTFLDALNNLPTAKKHPSIIDVPKLDMLPSIEEAHSLPVSIFYIISQILKSIWPARPDNSCWTGQPIFSEHNVTRLRTLFLPSDVVENLSNLCRQRNVTITSLLTVLIARALAQTFPKYTRFTNTTAMSFRRFTGTDKRAMVNYVSSFYHRFSSTTSQDSIQCGGEFNWEAVKVCHQEIKNATAGPKDQIVGLLKFMNDYESWFLKKVGQNREHSFQVSNVGVIDGCEMSEDKPWIKRIIFSQSSSVTGAALVFNIASAKGGDMAIALTWQEGIVEVELAEKVLDTLEVHLHRLVVV